MKIQNKKDKKKKTSGITLIALVVTIVVLIILATISINIVFNENGIIKKAERAKDIQANALKADEESMNTLLEEYANAIAEPAVPTNPTAGTVVTKPSTWTSTQVTPIADGKGGIVPLPSDFYYVGGDYDTGLVISDKSGDTMNASGTSMGNQFVWIPVASEDDLTRTEFDTTTGQPTTGLDTTDYKEPYASGYSTEESEYNTMKAQVLQYGGFYIGRYEAGVNSTALRTKVTTNQTVVVKKGVAPYNYVPWGKSMSDITTAFVPTYNNSDNVSTNGAVYLATNFDTQEGYTSVTSTLCYGSQWDAMCRYIGDPQRTITPTKDAPDLTGSLNSDVSKNIYDLAGNCFEWTMEALNVDYYVRVVRGGYYSHGYPVSYRLNGGFPYYDYDGNGFRCTLYIK